MLPRFRQFKSVGNIFPNIMPHNDDWRIDYSSRVCPLYSYQTPFHFFRSTRRLRISVRSNALWLSIVTEENDGAE